MFWREQGAGEQRGRGSRGAEEAGEQREKLPLARAQERLSPTTNYQHPTPFLHALTDN
ncbi:hypothetical protein H6G17_19455 [Chroococcidiopsis sp. FACHB-1243]|uniref:hypothetical protein n=1 Tax=Chroococcidiopsis sp. [FACHB-1243] TaxID=2692781 RepID=UPI00177E210D|nr:hypothetical protein [Chroococcidiopsis sp. [FACHB-1243]]MBD2307647.1 hypothetical protein [Chroococcidiopsis sp. [FACHB-1243]]